MRDRSFNEKAIEKADALVDEGYSKDKIYHILSEDYIDKSSLKMLVAGLDTKRAKEFSRNKAK